MTERLEELRDLSESVTAVLDFPNDEGSELPEAGALASGCGADGDEPPPAATRDYRNRAKRRDKP